MSLVRSRWAFTPPSMSGDFNAEYWSDAGQMPVPGGMLLVKNDCKFLYLALDIPGITIPEAADYFWLSFDVDGNRVITSRVDLNYGISPSSGKLVRQYYCGAGAFTGILREPTPSAARRIYAPSPVSASPHRIWELCIYLSEIGFRIPGKGKPPHLDVQFTGPTPLAIESKFTETYHRKTRRNNKDTNLDEYLKHPDIWNAIPKVKVLAESIVQKSGARTDFEYLDVPQLIKHVLGLTCSYRNRFSLLYLWYKVGSSEAKQHENELDRFSTSIKDEISFQIMTYQDLFNRIKRLPAVGSAYLKYLERRYFSVS